MGTFPTTLLRTTRESFDLKPLSSDRIQARLDDNQVGCGLCASCAPHRGWLSGHLFSFPCSPTYWVTLAVVSEPTAHLPVRLCQAITALPIGTARTPSPWVSRPVGDPMFRAGGTC